MKTLPPLLVVVILSAAAYGQRVPLRYESPDDGAHLAAPDCPPLSIMEVGRTSYFLTHPRYATDRSASGLHREYSPFYRSGDDIYYDDLQPVEDFDVCSDAVREVEGTPGYDAAHRSLGVFRLDGLVLVVSFIPTGLESKVADDGTYVYVLDRDAGRLRIQNTVSL